MWKKPTTFCLLLIIFFKNYHQRAKSIAHTKWSHNTVSFLRLIFVSSVGGSDQTIVTDRPHTHSAAHWEASAHTSGVLLKVLSGDCEDTQPAQLLNHPPTDMGTLMPGKPGISALKNNPTFNHYWCSTLSKSKLSFISICTASATAARHLLTRGDKTEERFPDEWRGSTAKTVSRL